jgi:Calcineurin-like phosphoesterase
MLLRQTIILSAFFLLPAAFAAAQEVTDGPYVIYQNGQIQVTTVQRDDDLLQPKTTVYKDSLLVSPENHAEWRFYVKLRPISSPKAECSIENDEPVFFMSDIEGEFAPFRNMLLAAGVIDAHYNWTYGHGSLVIAGDLFDRGKDVVPELWLLYKLEGEAAVVGGRVHVILGNHDIMNLSGDHRYTDGKYFKDAWLLHTDCTGLFGRDTELGRWLRAQNVIEKIGDLLVMHGGMSPAILAKRQSVEALNNACRPYFDRPWRQLPDSLQDYFNNHALFWYRGYFMTPKITDAQVDSTLSFYGCKWIVVGHTILAKNIALYQKGKVVALDVDEHKGHTAAALYQNGKWQVMDLGGTAKALRYEPKNDDLKDSDIL